VLYLLENAAGFRVAGRERIDRSQVSEEQETYNDSTSSGGWGHEAGNPEPSFFEYCRPQEVADADRRDQGRRFGFCLGALPEPHCLRVLDSKVELS